MRRSHESAHLLMRHLHILHDPGSLFQRDIKAANTIARIAEYPGESHSERRFQTKSETVCAIFYS
jgi:hypothetical protein